MMVQRILRSPFSIAFVFLGAVFALPFSLLLEFIAFAGVLDLADFVCVAVSLDLRAYERFPVHDKASLNNRIVSSINFCIL